MTQVGAYPNRRNRIGSPRKLQIKAIKTGKIYLNENCTKLLKLYNIMSKKAHRHIHQISGRSSSKFTSIKDRKGKFLIEEDDVCRRWSEYMEALYDNPNRQQLPLRFEGHLFEGNFEDGNSLKRKITRMELLKILSGPALCNLREPMNTIYSRGTLMKKCANQSSFLSSKTLEVCYLNSSEKTT